MKCEKCKREMKRYGFTYRAGRKVQRWMCTNEACSELGKQKIEREK